MNRFFLKIYDSLVGHRLAVRLSVTALLVVCAVLALCMNYDEDISSFMPLDGESKKYSEVFSNMVGQNRIAVVFNGSASLENKEEAMERFGEAVAARDTTGMIRNLQVRVDEGAMLGLIESVWQNYPLLLTDNDYLRLDSAMAQPGYFADRMEQIKLMLMLPTGGFLSQSLPTDPLAMSGGVTARLQGLNVDNAYRTMDGYLFKDSAGIVLLESPFGISESHNNQLLQEVIDSCICDVRRDVADVDVSAIGAPLIAVTNATQIKSDSLLAVSLAVVLIVLVLVYSFRRVGDIAWIGVSVFAGWLFALGVISLLRDGISLIVIGIGSVIIGIASNYPLHFIEHLKHEGDMRETLREMAPPLLVGNITTVSAFLCLVLLDAQAMRDLGLFGSLTLIGTILFVLICLPVVMGRRSDGQTRKERSISLKLLSLPDDRRIGRIVLWIVAGITIVLGYFSLDTTFDSDMQNINYMLPEQRQNLRFLSSSVKSQSDSLRTLYVVAEGATMDEALVNNEQLCRALGRVDGVARVTGIGDMLHSADYRRERAERWNSFWCEHRDVPQRLSEAASAAGFSDEAFAPFTEMVENGFDAADTTYNETFYDIVGNRFVMTDSEGCKIVNFVQVDAQRVDEVKQNIAAAIPTGSFVFSQADVSNHLAEVLSDSFNYIGFVCGFVVFLFLWISFGSIELSLLAFLPLAVSWIWILGIMNICGMQFNIVNIILATFIFGQGDDYTIFITEGLMYEYTTGRKRLEQYKNSVALSAVIMFIGIGTLIVSKHPAMRSLAEVAIIGMITVVVMAYYLPPIVFRWLTESGGKRREYPVTLSRLCYSLFSITFFICGMFLLLIPYTVLIHRPFCRGKRGESFYHRLLQSISAFVIRHVPGVKYRQRNPHGETFDKPAVIVCNHQSHLDLMCLMQLSPKIIVLTKDWVWHNPYYGVVIHAAEFRPVSNGFDSNFQPLKELVERGYSIVVFPEGTRTTDGEIGRFHKGAFTLAQALGVDILPVCIHGLYNILPKHDFMLRRGTVTLDVERRIDYDTLKDLSDRELTRMVHQQYIVKYAAMRSDLETEEYMAPYVAYKNKYKTNI
jgi:1-acyl-sn-glycerol-3-phosphate acyltransferase